VKLRLIFILTFISALVFLCGCTDKNEDNDKPVMNEVDEILIEKYGKPFNELPAVKLVVISPHNTAIQAEYENAFSIDHAVKHGQRVELEWRDVGGGGTAILRHLRNVYENSDRSGIDVVWGGGEYNFQKMADEGILQTMEIDNDVLANIPPVFSGLAMYDKDKRWCGSAISGFGFLYNMQLFDRLKIAPPVKWEDLGDKRFFGLVGLADPMQSGSAAASYEMIIQSGESWTDGWAKLLSILGNAKKFYDGAGDAAEALPSGEVAVSTCIDFYGINRVIKYPDTLKYITPKGQTAFNPDPIAILSNPPNPELAQQMVSFVLSSRGQALWALPVGDPDGPIYTALGRQPIRKDVYETYRGKLMAEIINPYAAGQGMEVDAELWSTSYGVLRQLVWAAAVKNLEGLRKAKENLYKTGFNENLLKEFNTLPPEVATREKVAETAKLLRDKKQNDIIVTEWIEFFRKKYKRVAD